MIRRLPLLLLGAALPLAACNSSPTVTATNASAAEVAAKAKAAGMDGQFVSPGRWEAKMTVLDVQMPGLPPAMQAEMKKHMGEDKTFVSCLTPEEAKKPSTEFFDKGDKSCRYERFTMGNGIIDSVMKCDAASGGVRTTTMKGTYSPDAYSMSMTSTGTGNEGNPMGAMTMSMKLDAKRTGACTGKEDG